MKKLEHFFAVLLLAILPAYTFAWGRTGHQIVAEIAMQHLEPAVKANVLQYLDGTTPEEASVWMDEMRSDDSYNYMKPWHYINVEKGENYQPNQEPNIMNELDKVMHELGEKNKLSNEQARTDLMILFHLMGDLHQPLHVGYGADKGGNTIQLAFIGHPTNLHHVWDDEIIQDQHIQLDECLKLSQSYSAEQLKAIQNIDLPEWMKGSRSLLDLVYSFNGHKAGEDYAQKMKPVIEQQLAYAGIRLASVLNACFRTSSYQPEKTPKTVAAAPQVIHPEEAKDHIGETETVCGKVYGGKYLDQSNGTPTLINMGAAYPNSPFTFVIFGDDRSAFDYKPERYLDGKKICVTGKIKDYKGKPEIIVSREDQIKVQ